MFKKNKNMMIIVGVAIVVLLGVGGYFLTANKLAKPQQQQSMYSEDAIKISASEIGLKLELTPDNKKVRFIADKLTGYDSIEWTFNYDADIPADQRSEADGITKVSQAFGSDEPLNLKGESNYSSEFRELGTCSRTCRYDTGVEKVNLVLYLYKNDGKKYQADTSIDIK